MPSLTLRGVSVEFPFEPYDCQVAYMNKVIECLQNNQNGILESPTGTGKTLCLLCASLAWLQTCKTQVDLKKQAGVGAVLGDKEKLHDDLMRKISENLRQSSGSSWGANEYVVPKIIYASRTHSQLSQAIQELKRTAYNSMNSCVLGSREQLCIDEKVSKETSNTSKVHMCRAKVQARRCHYYNVLDDFKKNAEVRSVLGTVVDIEDLVSKGRKNKICPYYMARELKGDADIIFMPYNYLLDPKSRRAHGVELQGNIIIFDEAHNLERICEDSASFDLSSVDIATAMEECTTLMAKVIDLAENESQVTEFGDSAHVEPDFNLEEILKLKETLQQLEARMDEIKLPAVGQGVTKSGMFMFELLAQVNISFETKNIVIDILEKVVAYLTSEGASSSFHSKGAGLSKFNDVLKIVFSQEAGSLPLKEHQEQLARYYKVHLHRKERMKKRKADPWGSTGDAEKPERILSYWCFSPGHSMRDLKDHGVKSIILTSGTLSPIESFTMEMQISFPVCLENPHVIDKQQVFISVVSHGPDNTVLNSSYETRFNVSYQASLGNAVFNFARVVPNGLLIFFPSYPVMDKCIEYWQDNNIWSRITQYKPVFVEPKGKQAFNDAMEEYYEKIHDPTLNGAIFIAVCRGKVSEGLDFSDNNGRAVMITGLPFPPRMDPKVVLKMQFLDEMKRSAANKVQTLSGQAWYRQQASRAVNQAIGRVIRHKQDFGAILLCDTRFGSRDSLSQLPVWVRPEVRKPPNFGHTIRDMMSFFKTAQKMLPAVQTQKKSRTEESACHGASFLPTFSRAMPKTKISYEQASNIACHVPSLRENPAETFSRLSQQYKGQVTPTCSSSKQTLLQALEHEEKNEEKEDDVADTQIPSHQPVRQNPAKKRRIVITRPGEKVSDQSPTVVTTPSASTSKHLNKAEDFIVQVKKVLSPNSYKQLSRSLLDYRKEEDLTKITTVLADLFTGTPDHYYLFRKFYRYVRPQHKQEFDRLCTDITGQGCGYKPEHSVSAKRLQQDPGANENKEKKSKLESAENHVSLSGISSLSQSGTSKLTSVDSLPNSQLKDSRTNSDMHEAKASNTPDVANALNSCDSANNKSKANTSVLPLSGSSSNCRTSNRQSSEQQQEKQIAKKAKVKTGYTCGKCKVDCNIPFRAQCNHVCCYLCWKDIFQSSKACPECGEKVRRRHLTQLIFASGPNIEAPL